MLVLWPPAAEAPVSVGYNMQTAVDTENHLIVATTSWPTRNDLLALFYAWYA